MLGNDQGWVDQVLGAVARTEERVWQLPLVDDYRKLLDSNVADLKNVGGPYGGAITAALFLREFVGDVPWAHLDIAGVMDSDADDGIFSKGSTGYGVRLFADLLGNYTPPRSIRPTPAKELPARVRRMASAATGGGTPTSARWRSTSSGSSPAVSMVWAMASARQRTCSGKVSACWAPPSRRAPAADRPAAAGPGGG